MDLPQPTYLSIGFVGWAKISIRQNESHLPETRRHYNTFVGGWLAVHPETVCVCVCFSSGASRIWKHATRHFKGGASLLSSGDTQLSNDMSNGIRHTTVGGSIEEQKRFGAYQIGLHM